MALVPSHSWFEITHFLMPSCHFVTDQIYYHFRFHMSNCRDPLGANDLGSLQIGGKEEG